MEMEVDMAHEQADIRPEHALGNRDPLHPVIGRYPRPREPLANHPDVFHMMADLGEKILRRLDEDRAWQRVQMESKRVEVELLRVLHEERVRVDERTNRALAELASSQTLLAEALRRSPPDAEFVQGSSTDSGGRAGGRGAAQAEEAEEQGEENAKATPKMKREKRMGKRRASGAALDYQC